MFARPRRRTRAAPLGALLAAVALAAAGTAARPAAGETLEATLARALEASPRLEAARAQLRAVEVEPALARAAGRPQLQGTVSQGYAVIQDAGGGGGRLTTRNAVELRQPVHTGGALAARRRQADRAVEGERARLAAVEAALIMATVEAYGEARLGRVRADLAADREARARIGLEAFRQRFRFGDLTATDVARAEARLAGAAAGLEAAEAEAATALLDLARVAGEPDGAEGGGGDLMPLTECPVRPATLDDALAGAAEHPLVAAAEADLLGADAGVDLALSALRPQLALNGRLAYLDQPESDVSRRGEASLAAVVTWPLYAGGAGEARVRQARQGAARRRHEAADLRRALERDARAAWRAREAARARLDPLRAQARAAAIALDGSRREALAGARDPIELLDAEADLHEAELAVERARHDELLAGWTVAAAAGFLSAGALGLPPATGP